MPLAGEQDSQIMAPGIGNEPHPSSPIPKSNGSHSLSAADLTTKLADDFEHSNQYNVAADSNPSFIVETQFITLEKDTQAFETQQNDEDCASAAIDRFVPPDSTTSSQLLSTKNNDARTDFFVKPVDSIDTQEIAQSFKFSAANKPVAGQFNRLAPKLAVNSSSAVSTISTKSQVAQLPSGEFAVPVQRLAGPPRQHQGSLENRSRGPFAPINLVGKSISTVVSSLGSASLLQANGGAVDHQGSTTNASHVAGNLDTNTSNLALVSAPRGTTASHQRSRLVAEKFLQFDLDPISRGISTSARNQQCHQSIERAPSSTTTSRRASVSIPVADLQTHQPLAPDNDHFNAPQAARAAASQLQQHEHHSHRTTNIGASDELLTQPPGDLPPQSEKLNGASTVQRTNSKGRRAVPFPSVNNCPFPEVGRSPIRDPKQHDTPTIESQYAGRTEYHNENSSEPLSPGAKSNTGRVRDPACDFEQVDAGRSRPLFKSTRPTTRDDRRMNEPHELSLDVSRQHQDNSESDRVVSHHSSLIAANHDETCRQSLPLVKIHPSKPNEQLDAYTQASQLGAQAKVFQNGNSKDHDKVNRRVDDLGVVYENNDSNCASVSIGANMSLQESQSHLLVTTNKPSKVTAGTAHPMAGNILTHEDGFEEMQDEMPNHQITGGEENGQAHTESITMEAIDHELSDPQSSHSSPQQPSSNRTDTLSRPHSRRSNLGKPMTRPLTDKSLRSAELTDRHRGRSTSRVKKSHSNQNHYVPGRSQSPISERQRVQPINELLLDYQKFLANGTQYCNMLQDFERQKELVETQKREIEELTKSDQSSKQQISKLESEKKKLDDKVKRLTDHCSKYKNHMNDVVKSQKFLKAQAVEIKQSAKEIIDARAESRAKAAALLQKLSDAIKEAGEIRAATEKHKHHEIEERNKQLSLQNERFAKKNKELSDDLSQSKLEKKTIVSENIRLVAANDSLGKGMRKLESVRDELREENDKALEENENLKNCLQKADKLNEQLNCTLQRNLLELGREKRSTELLQRTVETQLTAHKELLDILRQTPSAVAQELVKGESVLSKIIGSVNATQTKIDEATSLINNLNSTYSEPPPSLVNLIKGLSLRLENEAQAAGQMRSTLQESTNKLVEDLKGSLDQLRLDKETETRLNNRILELEQTNSGFKAEKSTLEHDKQNLSKQLDELRGDLENCRTQLSSKSDELAAALAAPKEDPVLKAKVQNLESTNSGLGNQLEIANQNIAKLREEVQALHDESNRKDQQVKELERNFDSAQTTIKNFGEERAKYIADKEHEKEKVCQDLARDAEAHEATVKSKLEAEVQKLEQKQKEKEAELSSTRQELQHLQEMHTTLDTAAKKCQADLNTVKENFALYVEHVKRLEERNPGREVSAELGAGLQSARNEMTELRHQIEFVKNSNTQSHQYLIRDQQTIEGRLLAIDVLEKQRDAAENQVAKLKMDLESHKAVLSRQLLPHSDHVGQSVERTPVARTVAPIQQAPANDESILRGFPVSTSEGILHQVSRQVASSSGLRIAAARHNQALCGVSRTSATPLHRAQTSTTTTPLLPPSSTPRQRRPAMRKGSNLEPLNEDRHEKQWSDVLERASQFQAHSSSTRKVHTFSNLDLESSANTSTPKTSQDPTTLNESSSPLSDIDSDELDLLGEVQNEKQPRDAYVQTRSSKTSVHDPSSSLSKRPPEVKKFVQIETTSLLTSLKRNHVPPKYDFSDEEPSLKKAKISKTSSDQSEEVPTTRIKVPSVAEESRKRRESKPMKSALKKATAAQYSSRVTANEAKQHLANDSQPTTSTTAGTGRRKYNAQSSVMTRGPSMYKGVVEGRSAKAPGSSSAHPDQTTFPGKSLAQKSAWMDAFFKQTLPQRGHGSSSNAPPRQKSRIRVAPARRTVNPVIPDSQEPQ